MVPGSRVRGFAETGPVQVSPVALRDIEFDEWTSHHGCMTIDGIEDMLLKAMPMAQLTVRKLSAQVVDALKRRAAAHGRSAEAEHREVLRKTLLADDGDFAERARIMRQRLQSSVDGIDTVARCRDDVSRTLDDSPSLRRKLPERWRKEYALAPRRAVHGLARDGVGAAEVPADPPWTLDQVIDPDWWPASRHGRP